MIPVQPDIARCTEPACRATGRCRGYPWRCHRTLAEVAAEEEASRLRPRLPASEIGT